MESSKKYANLSLDRNVMKSAMRMEYADEQDSPHPTGHVIAKGRAIPGKFTPARSRGINAPVGPIKLLKSGGKQLTAKELKEDQEKHHW